MPGFEFKITKDQGEIQEAQRLRFEVFNLEMKRGLQSSYELGLDVDEYDSLCDHLIVRDLKNRRVVGTYRLFLGSEARKHFGFYSEREFNLQRIKELEGEQLEMGRTCAHKDYRDKAMLLHMWDAIAEYVKTHRVRYLFGCASLYTTDPREVSESFALLKKKHYAPEEVRVQPLPDRAFPDLDENIEVRDEQRVFFRLPSLIKGYLRVGAVLCGPPALDLEFASTDFFLLLDVNRMSREYLRRYGYVSSKVHSALG